MISTAAGEAGAGGRAVKSHRSGSPGIQDGVENLETRHGLEAKYHHGLGGTADSRAGDSNDLAAEVTL